MLLSTSTGESKQSCDNNAENELFVETCADAINEKDVDVELYNQSYDILQKQKNMPFCAFSCSKAFADV